MSDNGKQLYEGLFLMNNATIGSDLGKGLQFVQDILARAEAEVEAVCKWDDRRLAYDIKGQKRGLYLLAYFKVSGGQIPNIERDVTLSEEALRCMILRADHIGDTELELARQKASETRDAAALAASREAEATDEPSQDQAPQAEAPAPAPQAAPAEAPADPAPAAEVDGGEAAADDTPK